VVILVVIVLLSGTTTLAQDNERIWTSEFVVDVPAGTFAEGVHEYWFEASWTVPAPGGWPPFGPYEFTIDDEAPIYKGYALLRPGYGYAQFGPPNRHCEALGLEDTPEFVLHPDQPMRFHVGWPIDWEMTYPEARAHLDSMTLTATWGSGTAELVHQEIYARAPDDPGWGNFWANQMCNWTKRK
jgi:hypothetical protein